MGQTAFCRCFAQLRITLCIGPSIQVKLVLPLLLHQAIYLADVNIDIAIAVHIGHTYARAPAFATEANLFGNILELKIAFVEVEPV